MLLLSSTWHFHSCLLTTQAKGWAHFYEKPVNAASTKNHKKKKFFIPGVKCCGSICFEGFHFHDYQQNPSVWPSRYTLRSMQLQGCVYLPCILTKWNLGFLKAMWKIKPHMWTAPNKSEARVNKSTTKAVPERNLRWSLIFFQFSVINISQYILSSNCFLFLLDP